MYSNITFNKKRQFTGSVLMTVFLTAFISIFTFAQPYINGPLSTGATSGATAAPAGYTWSELQGTNTGLGSGANIGGGFTLADDFVVPVGQTWNTTKITFYAYSTGYVGATSPFNDTRVQIFNTNPSVGTPVPVFGNLTTNRFLASSTANIYRIGNAALGTTREVWKIEATVVATLTAGTYWVEWQHGTIAAGASNFSPSKTIVGQPTQVGNNGTQHTITGNVWTPIVDAGGPQDFPFQIDYVPTGAACTATSPGATTATPAAVCPGINFNLSVATPGTGIGLVYQWQRSTDNITYTDVSAATTPTLATSQTTATWYRLRVTCGANAPLLSTALQVPMSTNCYCVPSTINCALSDFIANVNFAGINNTSVCTTGGYNNYTTSITAGTPLAGATNPISVTVGPGGTEHVGVWIDYNQNGTFDATEFTYLGSANGAAINGNIVIPSTALLGLTRMRVRVQWNTAVVAANSCTQPGIYGEVEDYLVNLIPCVPVTITTQPANATAVCGGNTTFTVGATGSLPSYSWQYRTSATSTWQVVPNAPPYSNVNTPVLTVATNSTLNGFEYRAIVTGACSGLNNSNIATLTVNTLVLNVTPTSGSICSVAGTPLLLSVPNSTQTVTFTSSLGAGFAIPDGPAGAGPVPGVNTALAVSGIPVGANILDISVKLNITHTYVGDLLINLKSPSSTATTGIINLVGFLNAGAGNNATPNFTNTVVSSNGITAMSGAAAPRTATFKADGFITTSPPLAANFPSNGGAANVNNWSSLITAPNANGNWVLYLADGGAGDVGTLLDWSISITYGAAPATAVFTPAAGLFTNALGTIPYVAGTAVGQVYASPTATSAYSAVVTTGLCSTAAQNITVNVNTQPAGTLVTAPVTVCAGKNAVFGFTGLTAGTGLTYQWQVSTSAVPTFTNIAGATAASYTATAATTAMSGNKYRVIVSASGCTLPATILTSSDGLLTVNANPTAAITVSPLRKLFPGLTTNITAVLTPNATGATYQWVRNGTNVVGATSSTYKVNIDGVGSYTVNATDANGCQATIPADVVIADSVNKETLFVYPSPNNGKFQVRYYNDANDTRNAPGMVVIFDEKGSRIFSRNYSPGLGYGSMQVDLGAHSSGIYRIDLLNSRGERIKTGNVIVF